MKTNTAKKYTKTTHGGVKAFQHLSALDTLRRSVMTCMLWEKNFYENGEDIADRIMSLSSKVTAQELADIAIEARTEQNMRHVSLLLLVALAKHHNGRIVGDTIYKVIQRADELTEFLALYWRNGKSPLAKQVKLGLARAFRKFNAYQLAKYNRDAEIKLRDVLFLVHAKPKDKAQERTWSQLVDGTLPSADTWEVALSSGKDKYTEWTRLLEDGKLGYMALLRNLRNMEEVGVDRQLMADAIIARKGADKVLPFRYVAAARACHQMEPELDQAMQTTIDNSPVMSGHTIILVDVSGSMFTPVSRRSDITRADAAAALAAMINGKKRVFSFSNRVVEVPPRRGMAGVDAILSSQPSGGTDLATAVSRVNALTADRLIVITDEQATLSATRWNRSIPDPNFEKAYMINVASYENGVGYGRWTHIDGWSEKVLQWIIESENEYGTNRT